MRAAADGAEIGRQGIGDRAVVAAAAGHTLLAAANEGFGGNVTLFPTPLPSHSVRLDGTLLWGVSGLAFAGEGRTLLVAGHWYDVPALEIWDLDELEEPIEHWRDLAAGRVMSSGAVVAFAETRGGDRVAVGGAELVGVLAVGRLGEGLTLRMSAAGHRVRSLALTPDDAFLLTAGDEGKLRAWRMADGAAVLEMAFPAESHIAMTADGRWLAGAGEDGWLRVWGCDG